MEESGRQLNNVGITALAALHLAGTAGHGIAHSRLAVGLSPVENVFVITVILLAPLIGALLVWTRYVIPGVWLFTTAMLAAFLFGAYHHYVLVSPDHIDHLPSGPADVQSAFITSAAVIAFLELASALYGAFSLGSLHKSDRLPIISGITTAR